MTPAAFQQETGREALSIEARALGRFILRRKIDNEFIGRYIEAHNHLFVGPQPPRELVIVRVASTRPFLLPCLDAAAALRQPDSLLHKKALLMAAILETSPRYADEFLPRRCGWFGLALLSIRLGLCAAACLVIGVPTLWFLRSRA